MSKIKIDIVVGMESSPEEIDTIKKLFSEDFDAHIANNLMRLSDADLPMTIYLFLKDVVVYGVAYDVLKNLFNKFFVNKTIKRKTTFVLREKKREIIIGENHFSIRENAKDTKYETIDEIFKSL